MNHPKMLKGFSTAKEVGQALENLQYDVLLQVIAELRKALMERAREDHASRRVMLAAGLRATASSLTETLVNLGKVWDICKDKK